MPFMSSKAVNDATTADMLAPDAHEKDDQLLDYSGEQDPLVKQIV